jgi:glycerol-3-phosphate dehydrogenase
MIGRVFPSIPVTYDQIVFRFSGVRPLKMSTAKTTGQYSRDHSIEVLSGVWTSLNYPVYSLVGGKWTSFRALAEQVTDKALAYLGKVRRKGTQDLPIGGGRGFPLDPAEQNRQIEGLAAWTGLDKDRLRELYYRYGSRVEALVTFIQRAQDTKIPSLPEYSQREIMYLALNEKVVHLDDLVLRRTMLAMLGKLTRENLGYLAGVVGEALGWGSDRISEELARIQHILEDRHGVRL